MIMGPRNSVIRILRGETIKEQELFADQSEWVCVEPRFFVFEDLPELWVDDIHDFVGEEELGDTGD